MSEKKNIDKLFKEQFKNFEVAPNDAIWQKIEANLDKDKRKRRVIPIWWKLAGVAATLLLLVTVANTVMNSTDSPIENNIVDTEKSIDNSISNDEKTNGLDVNTSEILEQQPLVESEKNSEEKNSKTNKNTLQNNLTAPSKSEINKSVTISEAQKTEEDNKNTSEADTSKSIIKNKSLERNAIVSNEDKSLKNKSHNINNSNTLKSTNTVVNNNTKTDASKNEVLDNAIKKENTEIDKLLKQLQTEKTTQVTTSNTSNTSNIENNGVEIDSSKALETTENAIEKAIAAAEKASDETIKDSTNASLKRWSLAPNMAPIYFNTLGTGSPIDEQFVDNAKEGEVNVSYGLKGAYAINEKFTIRAGVNKVNLGYSTNNVVTFTGPTASASSRSLQNVENGNSRISATYLSANNISFASGPEVLFLKEQGSINQQLGFIEVPIEIEYNVLNTKIGVNLIGGFSTLFLSDNDVYSIENSGTRTRLGEASNINDMSYSANFGIGFNYNLSQQLRFNLEPTFKYQINTFNDTSGNFQPFFIGVYTGLSFRF